jgi:hypothetical protein
VVQQWNQDPKDHKVSDDKVGLALTAQHEKEAPLASVSASTGTQPANGKPSARMAVGHHEEPNAWSEKPKADAGSGERKQEVPQLASTPGLPKAERSPRLKAKALKANPERAIAKLPKDAMSREFARAILKQGFKFMEFKWSQCLVHEDVELFDNQAGVRNPDGLWRSA